MGLLLLALLAVAPASAQSPSAPRPLDVNGHQHLARLLLDQKRDAEAAEHLRRAATLGALDRDLALKLASIEVADGHAAAAMLQLRSAADRFQSVQALLQLARLQSSQKDAAGARESLKRALLLAPNSEELLAAYSQISLTAHAPLPAILALEPLARMCPTIAQYHYLLGVGLMQAGDMEAAVESLHRAEALEPNRAMTLVALGLALNNRKLYAEARSYLLRSLEIEPEDVEATAALAESEDGLDEIPQAEAHAQRALGRSPANATANLVTGMILMKQERYAEARDALLKAVAASPASPKAYYQLSLAYARLGDADGSERHRALYQQKLREIEEVLRQLRTETGLSKSGGGMRP
jgi:tetratricopeptide (TPR) repeat protein